jgi:hypothetical protein
MKNKYLGRRFIFRGFHVNDRSYPIRESYGELVGSVCMANELTWDSDLLCFCGDFYAPSEGRDVYGNFHLKWVDQGPITVA